MSTLMIVILVVALLIAALLVYAMTRPDTFTVRRSLAIQAMPEKVFPYIDDFKNWPAWSPYEHRDPNLRRDIGGAPNGKGATYAWEGNRNVGKGRMEILESNPYSRIVIKLDFEQPFQANNTAQFTFEPSGNDTRVTWAMQGAAPFMAKLMGVFVNMDKIVGRDFEAGLAKLKQAAEAAR